jgi:hypothetical protein
VYKKPPDYGGKAVLSTDIRKKFRLQVTGTVNNAPENENFNFGVILSPRFRFSDKFNLSLSFGYDQGMNDYGWVSTNYDSLLRPTIYFGRRDITTFNNILAAQYIFNTRMSVTLRARHYWSRAVYLEYYTLNAAGTLDPDSYQGDHDLNYNAFTIDLQYTWYFAPGSEMSVVWKNAINTLDNDPVESYFTNFGNMVSGPQSNSISIRVLYWLDYLYLKKLITRSKKTGKQA